MAEHVHRDELAIIKIEGMHCHRCEEAVQKALAANPGVHEVEVDFAIAQASVLYDPAAVKTRELVHSVVQAGYRVAGFTQRQAGHAR